MGKSAPHVTAVVRGTEATVYARGMGGPKDTLGAFRERAQKMLTADHFTALGLPKTASPADVQKAFIEAVKTWHPDRVPAELAELKPLVIQVFGRLEAARGTLSDTGKRLRYIDELAKPASPATEADRSAAEATFEFKKAEAFLKRNDAATAEPHLRRAVQLAPNNAEYRSALAWLQVKPTSTRPELVNVLAELDRALTLDKTNKRALFYRAQLRKRLDLVKEAYADFLRVTELDPANIDAQREVRLYKMREEKEPSNPPSSGTRDTGGFLRKLFKK